MSTVFQCDGCGQIMRNSSQLESIGPFPDADECDDIDLCDNCRMMLLNVVREKKGLPPLPLPSKVIEGKTNAEDND